MDQRAKDYFNKFRSSLSSQDQSKISLHDSYYFCADELNANLCADLVLKNEKRATAGLLWSYQAENEPLPEAGQLCVITNWKGDPQCIIEVTEVEIQPFNQVSADFAFEEGEGDKSLDFWRRVHWKFFSLECEEIGKQPAEDMPVVLEKFKIRWRE